MFGVIFAFLAAGFATAKDTFSKSLSASISGTVSAFTSFAFALPFYGLLLLVLYLLGYENFYTDRNFWTFVILRAITDSFAELFKMHSFKYADLSIVSSIISLNLIFLLFTSPFITGDIPNFYGAFGVVLSALGSIFVVSKKTEAKNNAQKKGIILALLSALFFSLNACFDRMAVQSSSAAMSGFGMTLLSCFILLPLVIRNKTIKTEISSNLYPLFTRGFLEVTFMVFKLMALQYLQAPYVAGITRAALIFSIISGRIVFKEENFKSKLLGGFLIILGSLLIIFAGN